MALKDNNPTFSYISWKDLLITYENETYQIQNADTNMKYIYWDIMNPYVLQCFNKTQVQKPGFYQVFINDNGIATERSHESLIISWDGNNVDLITKQIYGLHETNKENGKKFVSMETDIDGIKNTVGTSIEDEGSLLQQVSQIKQQADYIDLSVNKLEQTFSDDREITELRENLNKSMIDFNASLGLFKSEIYTYYKDNKISEEEKIKIDTHLDIMDAKKSEVVKYVDVVIVLMEGKGQTTEVNRLNSVKTKFVNSVNNLRTYITTAISDGTTVPSEIVGIVDLFAKCNSAINDIKNACDDAIYLGAGGKISEELARIGVKSDEIILSVSKNEEDIRSNLSVEKGLLQGDITDFRNEIDNTIRNLNSIFKDGIVSAEEKEVVNLRITSLTKEKLDIDSKYIETYNNQYLSQLIKNQLQTTYEKFNNKFTEMTEKIKSVISDDFVNEAEKAQVDTVINEMLSETTLLHSKMVESVDDIQLNMNKAEIKAVKDEVQGNINSVNNKVEDLGEYVNGTFENNILDETERKDIKSNLDNLIREKADIDNQYAQLSLNKNLDGILKTNYTTAYNNFISKYTNLINILNGILEKTDLINNTDRDNMNSAYSQLNETIGVFIKLSNEVLEYISKKEAELVKDTLGKEIGDVDKKINDLNSDINGVFKDSIIDESERNAIALNLKDLETQKIDVDAQYNQFILSTYLDGVLRVELETKYNESVLKYNELTTVMSNILNKPDLINNTDRANLDAAKDAYNITIGEFSRTANKVIEYIGKKQSEGAVGDFSKQLDDLNKKVDGILDDVSGAIADDIIDETERIAIKQSLKNLENDFIANESEYLKIYNNSNLVGSIKTELNTVFNSYSSKYNNLVNVINSLLDKVGNIDNIDREKLDNAYMEYGTAIRLYLSKFYEAMDSITNKGIADAKKELNKEITDLTSSLTNLEDTMNGVFKDGVLSDAKKESIKQNLQVLATEKADIDKSYSVTYSNVNLIGVPKSDLKSSYDLYNVDYNNLIKVINDILNKTGMLDSTDQAKLDTAFSKHRTSLSTYKEKYNIAIDSITNKGIADAKSAIQKEIGDLNNALDNLEDTMNNAFKDGVLSDAEKLAMKQQLQVVSTDKVNIDNQYKGLYENPDLLGEAKTNLKTAYDTYILKYNNLIGVIDGILNKVGLVDSTDQNNLNNSMNEYRTSVGEYSKRANEAIDSIARKKADDAEKNVKTYTDAKIKVVNDAINLKVSKTEYDNNNKSISEKFTEVNQTTEKITSTVKEVGTKAGEAYEKSSTVEQSLDRFKFDFTTPTNNIVENSNWNKSIARWYKNGSPEINCWESASWIGHDRNTLWIKNTAANYWGIFQPIKCIPGKVYTLYFKYQNDGGYISGAGTLRFGMEGLHTEFRSLLVADGWHTERITFTATQSEHVFIIYMAHGAIYAEYSQIVEGNPESQPPWTPHANEVFNNGTEISDEGILVKNGAIRIENQESTDVFWVDKYGQLCTDNIYIYGAEKDANLEIGGVGNKGIGIRSSTDGERYIDFCTVPKGASWEQQVRSGQLTRLYARGGDFWIMPTNKLIIQSAQWGFVKERLDEVVVHTHKAWIAGDVQAGGTLIAEDALRCRNIAHPEGGAGYVVHVHCKLNLMDGTTFSSGVFASNINMMRAYENTVKTPMDILNSINFIDNSTKYKTASISSESSNSGLLMDVGNIIGTPYADVDENGNPNASYEELLKLALLQIKECSKEIETLKNEVSLLKNNGGVLSE